MSKKERVERSPFGDDEFWQQLPEVIAMLEKQKEALEKDKLQRKKGQKKET